MGLKVGVPRPAASASPGTLLEMHSPRPHRRLTESEPSGVTSPPGDSDAHQSSRSAGCDGALQTPGHLWSLPVIVSGGPHEQRTAEHEPARPPGLRSTAAHLTDPSLNIRSHFPTEMVKDGLKHQEATLSKRGHYLEDGVQGPQNTQPGSKPLEDTVVSC